MDKIGCLRITMPAVQPKELWEESSRWDKYGKNYLGLMIDMKENSVLAHTRRSGYRHNKKRYKKL